MDIEVDITGVHPPPERMIEVVFNVLIPANIWGWNEKCEVHLRFGHTRLGRWKKNIGNFDLMR